MPIPPLKDSTHYRNGRFFNSLPHTDPPLLPMLKRWFFEKTPDATPTTPVAVLQRSEDDFAAPPTAPRVTWFGHSSLLLEMAGQRILIDPVWGDYASPGAFFGVKRFYPPPLAWEELPTIDAVILSHDHYDHLDATTIRRLATSDVIPKFFVPLGVAARLIAWGIPPEKIQEADWWDELTLGDLKLVATPGRHFSGRFPWSRNSTLWCGWAFLTAATRIYYAGDSAMFPGFEEIGRRLGPFDLTMIEIGAYDKAWPDVHIGPEQAVAAHKMVGGNVLLPIHWALFKLAFHSWTEPVERVIVAAEAADVSLALPRPGGSVVVGSTPPVERWWPMTAWRTAEENPIISTGLGIMETPNG